jgi:hypothetical protein
MTPTVQHVQFINVLESYSAVSISICGILQDYLNDTHGTTHI